jgi:addiction module RelB/DinJ family antitoxin
MKTQYVGARVDARLKTRAGKILAQKQLTLSDGIRIFLAEVVQQKQMPVQLETATRIVSGRTLWKIKGAQQARDLARVPRGRSTRSRFLISPREARKARLDWPDADLDD